MLQSFSPSRCWDYETEPLLFDEEICQILMKDLHTLPTPPQSPPMKTGLDKPLSKVDQLEFVSELLLEEQDFLQLNWNCDLLRKDCRAETDSIKDQRPEVSDDCLWHCLGDKFPEEKLSSVLSGPLLSDIDTSIFEEIAGSTLDCHSAALVCQNEDLSSQQNESSDSSSLSAASDSSASDSEEEIDVVTVKRRGQTAHQGEVPRQPRPSAKRCHLEIQQHDIQLQHNYAAPRPASPRRADGHKRARGDRGEPQQRSRQNAAAAAAGGDGEDEEERRRTHNVMERQRRNELKNCFLRLRDHVPELSHNDKASKVLILKKARDGIRGLEAAGLRLAAKRDSLRRRQDRLKARLEQLRR
ncbi:myelocytomatosis oncogene homolog [Anguilla anguilla]|uniref:myelocytomatosis oncogene homolog n=1 Tax=Anguilla anguilla TaxID=7936 RepID=UPI0015AF4A46|nr:myelocytomatosis oncogene homolog [Anguilla anguilla]